ncbi:MAG TPA: hypothetical protein VHW44_15605 [Pseudonocardiaceae bacterium]|jgi:hypothetical protein|nr:hypothetical protein [Pseudonocardiaceae bacterium]
MHLAGKPSWRLSTNSPEQLHIALYLRDRARLVIPPAPEVPPALTGTTPDHSAVVPAELRAEAAAQWLVW